MYQVYYRCVYREYWYAGPETNDLATAVAWAQQIAVQRGTRVVVRDEYTGEVVWATY